MPAINQKQHFTEEVKKVFSLKYKLCWEKKTIRTLNKSSLVLERWRLQYSALLIGILNVAAPATKYCILSLISVYGSSFLSKQRLIIFVLKMSTFVLNKVYLRGILLHYFIRRKSAAEVHRVLVTYGDNITSRWVDSFETFETVYNDPEARELGAERRRTAFVHVWTTATTADKKSGYTTIIQSVENRWACHLQSQVTMVRFFSVFDGINRVSCIISCSNRMRLLRKIVIGSNWCVWVEPKKEKRRLYEQRHD